MLVGIPHIFVIMLLGLLMGGCTSTVGWKTGENEYTAYTGFGGLVYPIIARYDRMADDGQYLRISGDMVSADAWGAFGYKGEWCYTEDAVFQGHSASNLGLYPLPEVTAELNSRLPKGLRVAFENDMAASDWVGMTYWDADKLDTIAGMLEHRCTGERA